tara:strand:+ start:1038 stop:1274 length:237 start_codon:yes stop_codon:yes gene_type:complete
LADSADTVAGAFYLIPAISEPNKHHAGNRVGRYKLEELVGGSAMPAHHWRLVFGFGLRFIALNFAPRLALHGPHDGTS